jgi:hypothetical protein
MAIWSVEARDLTDDDFDDDDNSAPYKKKSGGSRKKDDSDDDSEAISSGLKKLEALRDKRRVSSGGRVSIEEELLGT